MVVLQRLDSATFMEKDVIDKWSNLIWTERYSTPGDFELNTPNIDLHFPLLPEGTLLCIDESREVMIVEDRQIDKTQDIPMLKVTGRTFESFLECRSMRRSSAAPTSVTKNDATIVIYHINDALAASTTVAADEVMQVAAVDASTISLPDDTWKVKQVVDVYSWAKGVLDGEKLALKNVRPDTPGYNLVMTVYNGTDRSTGTANPVLFDATAGHILKPSYLFSNKDYRNVAYVLAPIGFAVVYAKGTSSSVSGFNRRVLSVDATDITESTAGTVAATLARRGKRELAAHNKQATFDGELSPNVPYKYGTHYFLGDTVSFKGRYGIIEDMLVTEYIRSWSETDAPKAYPTMVVV